MSLIIRVRSGDKAKAFAREIKGKAGLITCSGCGRRDFGLLEQPDEGYRTFLQRSALETTDPHSERFNGPEVFRQPLISLICTNCGHVEQFGEAVLNGAAPSEYGEDVDE